MVVRCHLLALIGFNKWHGCIPCPKKRLLRVKGGEVLQPRKQVSPSKLQMTYLIQTQQ